MIRSSKHGDVAVSDQGLNFAPYVSDIMGVVQGPGMVTPK